MEKPAAKTERNSNIELLRILLMIALVASHYVHNSGLLDSVYSSPANVKSYILLFFGMWGKPAINCFVLITGYYMCTKQIKYSKIIKLVFSVLFYNIIIFVIFAILGKQPVNVKTILTCILPVTSVSRNFTSCYILFFFLIPFINALIKNLNSKTHLKLIIILLFIYTLIGSIPRFSFEFNYVSWFVILYILAAYIRLYPNKYFDSWKIWLFAFITVYIIALCSIIVGLKASSTFNVKLAYYFIEDSNKVGALLLSVSLFMLIKNIKVKTNRVINLMAAVTFDVLLIHANSDTMRVWLWNDVVNCQKQYSSSQWLLLALISVLTIYIVCVLFGLFRLYCLEKPLEKRLIKRIKQREN